MPTPQKEGVVRTVKGRPERKVDPDGYVVTFGEYGVEMRPLRVTKEDARVYMTWDQVYKRALMINKASEIFKKGGKK